MIDYTKFEGIVDYSNFKVEDILYKEGVKYDANVAVRAQWIKDAENPAAEEWAWLFLEMAICEGCVTAEDQAKKWDSLCEVFDIEPIYKGFALREV